MVKTKQEINSLNHPKKNMLIIIDKIIENTEIITTFETTSFM